ncbi:MAG TPA: protein-L-isoaspartate(D-aspartate) O-methyltransferase [Pseudomonadales bacterium]
MQTFDGIGMTSRRTRGRMIERLREQGISDEAVLDVMSEIPRHIFLDEALSHRAYEDTSLPIGYQQTLSQPYIVARMTELLLEKRPRKVLEVGTGSGYQSAVLARLVERVYSVERIAPLLEKARLRLRQLKLGNVLFRHADGGMGWPDRAPFDGILSAAAPRQVPDELKQQLAIGGRMVIPVGDQQLQHLITVDRTDSGFIETVVEPVRFVPLVSGRLA